MIGRGYETFLRCTLNNNPLFSKKNDWLIETAMRDASLADMLKTAAKAWIANQTENRLRHICLGCRNIHDIFGDDVVRKCVEYLGPLSQSGKALNVPVNSSDSLAAVMLVSRQWNEWAMKFRYSKISRDGLSSSFLFVQSTLCSTI